METTPQPRADNQPNPRHWRPELAPGGCFADRKCSTRKPELNGWERILTAHEELRQLIKQSSGGVINADERGRHRRPNMVLADYQRGPVSQAYGWIKTALEEDPRPKFGSREIPENYRGDPVEQSLLWLMLNFDPKDAEPEIIDTVKLLSGGRIEDARDRLEDYMHG